MRKPAKRRGGPKGRRTPNARRRGGKRAPAKPVVLITGAAGAIGTALSKALRPDYHVVGLDRAESKAADYSITFDLTSDDSIALALRDVRDRYGSRIASIVHLAAYFDFSGEESPLYDAVTVEGTRRLVRALADLEVEQFVFSGTMLVHAPCAPGERIDESAPIAPRWVYPESKARAEEAIREERGKMPVVLLRLAGLYDERSAVPTLSHQIARVYERDLKSRFYPGDPHAGQSVVHRDDMIAAFRRAIDRRRELPEDVSILIGEPDPIGYGALQDLLGRLIHGEEEWATLSVPKAFAKVGAWAETTFEPAIPDAIDQGEKPFIRPFMVELADDHYALDTSRARELLGWEAKHSLRETLPELVANLKADPEGWYEANGITPPRWMRAAADMDKNPEAVRADHLRHRDEVHGRFRWAQFLNMGMGSWLVTAPAILGYQSAALVWSDALSGLAVFVLSFAALSPRYALLRWVCAAIGVWLLFAPLVFWAPTAAAYLNGTFAGALVFGFAAIARPPPGVSAAAAESGQAVPIGWDFSPSSWLQRLPIIVLAFVGLYISRYLAAYQLGHIDGVWEPFFQGSTAVRNGTEEIITSSVSEAWPVSDAGVGAVTYMLEILTGLIGSARRWRTMPWLVALFGIMIVPLGIVSITFIVIQPIVIGTWCTLCLIAAAAMLIQIPYSLDELVATGQFLWRRKAAGRSLLRVFVVGDADAGGKAGEADEFNRPIGTVLRDIVGGGVGLPWNMALSIAIGVWLMFTRLTLGATGGMANADHLIGSLVVTVSVIALAEVARPVRFVNIGFGAALLVTPFAYGVGWAATLASVAAGAALIALSIPRGPIHYRFGGWERFMV